MTHSPMGMIKPISSANGIKVSGWNEAPLGVVPADECFEAVDVVARKIDDRLKIKFKLAGSQGLAQVALQRVSLLHIRIHLLLEEAESPAPVAFGPVQSHIGAAHQLFWAVAILWTNGNANARANHDLVFFDRIRCTD